MRASAKSERAVQACALGYKPWLCCCEDQTMSIAVFYLRNSGVRGPDTGLAPAMPGLLRCADERGAGPVPATARDERHAHVVISSGVARYGRACGRVCGRGWQRRPMEWTIGGARPGVLGPVAEMRPSHPGSARGSLETADSGRRILAR